MLFKTVQVVFLLVLIGSEAWTKEYKITDQVFFDMKVGSKELGRIVFGLFGEVAPRSCDNFKEIASFGIRGRTYANSKILKAIPRFMIQGGDIVKNDGTGSVSIYGKYFKDENFIINHTSAGLLTTVNNGSNTNGCQFMITTMSAPWLDGKSVVYGKVLYGLNIVHQIEHMKTDIHDRLLEKVYVARCGVLPSPEFYEPAENYELSLMAWLKAGWIPLGFSFLIMGFFHCIIRQLDKYKID